MDPATPLPSYEKLGVFYLGRRFDPAQRRATPDLLLLDSRDLVTHGLIVGMTGSGKTGLGVDLLEEAALDGIPSLVIDPKGDLANLLLTFPELRPEDFQPWVPPAAGPAPEAPAEGRAAAVAAQWRQGLAEWGQDGGRIRRLRDAAAFTVFTPGSRAGRPLSMLRSLAAPPPAIQDDPEALRDRLSATVSGLLGLAGVAADPLRSREAVLLGHLLQSAWAAGRSPDLATLIHDIQQPPLSRIGVLDLETFYPAKERFELVLSLNNLIASPAFAAWTEGDPIDLGRLLHTDTGRPRVAIVSIAHLAEAERMFVVTALLHEAVAWMRVQSGTGSLRAMLYMDEIAGYFPPVANPPSKVPLLTLLKQARAFGLGVVLATQNPVDLDYKGLANIGTWFLGRLQTERDQARVLDGLEAAVAARGGALDRASLAQALSALPARVFLLHSVHAAGGPEFLQARWTLSYLRGPLTREQLRALPPGEGAGAPAGTAGEPARAAPVPMPGRLGTGSGRPVLPAGVSELFLPPGPADAAAGAYVPVLLGATVLRFTDRNLGLEASRELTVVVPIHDGPVPVDWREAEVLDLRVRSLEGSPRPGAFRPPPAAALQAGNYPAWKKAFVQWLQASQRLRLFRHPALELHSDAAEDERAFRIRLQQVARERRDAAVEALRQTYAPKLAALQERLRRAEAAREREARQASRAGYDTLVSLGSTLLGAFLGRRVVSATTVRRVAGTMRQAGRTYDQAADIERARETTEAVEGQLLDLEARFEAESAALAARFDAAAPLESVEIEPERAQIQVSWFGLGWRPSGGTAD